VELEPLAHGPPAATVGIWRVRLGSDSAVLKVLRQTEDGSRVWPAASDPADPYWWRREATAYESGLLARLPGGVRAPACRGSFERADGSVALWLEDLGESAPAAGERLVEVVRALGRMQGALAAAPPSEPWLSRRWLRAYVELRGEEIAAYEDGPFADVVRELWAERERVLARIEGAPQTFCHLDFYPANVLGSEGPVLGDWAYCGLGALGEDASNLVPDSVFDGYVPLAEARPLADAAWTAYAQGLDESGWRGDLELVRWVVLAAAALKYAWIPPRVAARTPDEALRQRLLGGFELLAESWAEAKRLEGR
jgi:hypothetical protein